MLLFKLVQVGDRYFNPSAIQHVIVHRNAQTQEPVSIEMVLLNGVRHLLHDPEEVPNLMKWLYEFSDRAQYASSEQNPLLVTVVPIGDH